MNYLDASEYESHGLEATTPESWITSASALIDAHCRRATLAVTQYIERVRVGLGQITVRLTYLPLAIVAPAASPIVSARGRYASPRRGETVINDEWRNEVAQVFGLPGIWVDLSVDAIDFFADTGELTLPPGALGLGFSEVEITYQAGLATIPENVKCACVQVVQNALATPALNLRAGNLYRMHLEYFSDTLVDQTVRALLAPYVAQKVG
jgi:hypothetical protein